MIRFFSLKVFEVKEKIKEKKMLELQHGSIDFLNYVMLQLDPLQQLLLTELPVTDCLFKGRRREAIPRQTLVTDLT